MGEVEEENFCFLEGVASALNSSSSSSAIGPSNATLRLWVGVFVGVKPALGARRADLDGERLSEREGGAMGGGRVAAERFVGDVVTLAVWVLGA